MAELALGATVAAAAIGARYILKSLAARGGGSTTVRSFYKGGFESVMTKREAALILGLRQQAARDVEKVKQAYKKVMMANHPDAGGSPFIARKVNEARDLLVKTSKCSDSVF